MRREIDLTIGDYKLSSGDFWENRAIREIYLAYMLSPGSLREERETCRRIQAVFLDRLYDDMKKKAKRSTEATKPSGPSTSERALNAEFLKQLRKTVRDQHTRLARSKRAEEYLPELDFETADDARPGKLRGLFTVGLLVLILEDLVEDGINPTIGAAKRLLNVGYRTGNIWEANTNRTPKVWARYKSVAHFAAALVRVLEENNKLISARPALDCWQEHMDKFFAYAAHYRRFLSVDEVVVPPHYNRHTQKQSKSSIRQPLLKAEVLWHERESTETAKVGAMKRLPLKDIKRKALTKRPLEAVALKGSRG